MHVRYAGSLMALVVLIATVGVASVTSAAFVGPIPTAGDMAQQSADELLFLATQIAADLQAKANLVQSVLFTITANIAGQVSAAVALLATVAANLAAFLNGLLYFEGLPILGATAVVNAVVQNLIFLKLSMESIALTAVNALVAVLTMMAGNVTLHLNVSQAVQALLGGAIDTKTHLESGSVAARDIALATAITTLAGAVALVQAADPQGLEGAGTSLQSAVGAMASVAAGTALAGGASGVSAANQAMQAMVGGAVNLMATVDAATIVMAAITAALAALLVTALSAQASAVAYANWLPST